MKHKTTIETRGYVIDAPFNASNIKAFSAYNNKNIHFLPSNIADSFPDIVVFNVADCSIRGIFNENFRNLTKMEYLWLSHNKLSVIPDNAFEDSKALKQLSLGRKFHFLHFRFANF